MRQGQIRMKGKKRVDAGGVDKLLQFVTAEFFFFFGSSCSSSSSRCSWCSWCLVKRWMAEGGVDDAGECERAGTGRRWQCVALSYIGAAEMAQGRGRWRKWRGGVVGDGSGAEPLLFSFLLRSTWAAFCFITFIPFAISSFPS